MSETQCLESAATSLHGRIRSKDKRQSLAFRLAQSAEFGNLDRMRAAEIVKELEALPPSERADVARRVLETLYPGRGTAVDRLMRRLEHPDIPEDFWEAVEEVEDGKAIEMHDEHFERPPL